MRSRYWSVGKFADWVRGTPSPDMGTSAEWREWESKAKSAHPLRYWLAEEGLSGLQSVICWPIDRLYDVKYWINNRYVTKTHALTSNLKKGQWYDLDTRLLHCLFDELVNHVEIELAASNFRWDKEAREKYNTPFWAVGWFRWRTYRNSEAGMDYLNWAAELRWTENEVGSDSPQLNELTYQAINAREIRDLYLWWKHVYPNRPDPHDASGWTALCAKRSADTGDDELGFLDFAERSDEDREETRRVLDLSNQMETDQLQEEEDMLIRLIKVRKSLWT